MPKGVYKRSKNQIKKHMSKMGKESASKRLEVYKHFKIIHKNWDEFKKKPDSERLIILEGLFE
jgi:hypothetical protein